MSFDPIYIRQFSDYVYLQVEQKESHLLNLFRKETVKGKSDVIPRIGKVNMQMRSGDPLAAVAFSEIPTSFRYLSLNSWEVAVPITKYDVDRMKIDPTNYVGQRVASAIGRQIDQVGTAALLGSAATGETGGGTAATITQTVAVNDHTYDAGTGNVGLTVGKLINARKQILAQRKRMGLPTDDLVVLTGVTQFSKLFADDRFVSFFYNKDKPLAGDEPSSFLGMSFVTTEEIPQNSNSRDQVIVCDKNALVLGAPADFSPVVIEPRYDRQGNVWQVKGDLDFGAVRMEEELVVVIDCA